MVKRKEDTYVPEDIRVRVTIEPAFKITIAEDPSSAWYGDTAILALRRMRAALNLKQVIIDGKVRKHYGEIKVSTDTPRLVAATGWGEPTFD